MSLWVLGGGTATGEEKQRVGPRRAPSSCSVPFRILKRWLPYSRLCWEPPAGLLSAWGVPFRHTVSAALTLTLPLISCNCENSDQSKFRGRGMLKTCSFVQLRKFKPINVILKCWKIKKIEITKKKKMEFSQA